jgi:hypothetical protein
MARSHTCMGIFRFTSEYYDLFDSVVYELVRSQTGLSCHDARSYYEPTTAKMELIEKMIRESRLIIVEISEKNPNVFLEFGIAYSLKKQIIILCSRYAFKKVWEEKLPFDLQGREFIKYNDYSDLKIKLGKSIFDALYPTKNQVLSWHSNNAKNHVKSPTEIIIQEEGDIWGHKSLGNSFMIEYHASITEVRKHPQDPRRDKPDLRLLISPDAILDANNERSHRIVVIFPWEISELDAQRYECHIDVFPSPSEKERLQQVDVCDKSPFDINRDNPLNFRFFATFCWPNLVVESDLFDQPRDRLVVPLQGFLNRGFPVYSNQYVGFASPNSRVLITKIMIKEVLVESGDIDQPPF